MFALWFLAALLVWTANGEPAAPNRERVAYNEIRIEPAVELLTPAPGEQWTEGDEVAIRWRSRPDVEQVQFTYSGANCPIGGHSRGTFDGVVAARQFNLGSTTFKAPKLDAVSFVLRLAAYDSTGERIGADETTVHLRPSS